MSGDVSFSSGDAIDPGNVCIQSGSATSGQSGDLTFSSGESGTGSSGCICLSGGCTSICAGDTGASLVCNGDVNLKGATSAACLGGSIKITSGGVAGSGGAGSGSAHMCSTDACGGSGDITVSSGASVGNSGNLCLSSGPSSSGRGGCVCVGAGMTESGKGGCVSVATSGSVIAFPQGPSPEGPLGSLPQSSFAKTCADNNMNQSSLRL